MKKKILVLSLCAILMALTFSACSGSGSDSGGAESGDSGDSNVQTEESGDQSAAKGGTVDFGGYSLKIPDKDPKDIEIAVVYMNTTVPFAQAIKQGVDQGAAEFGVNAYMTGKETWDTALEIDVVQNLITKGVDGLAVAVMDEPGMTPIIQEALKAGIPTVTFNVDAPDSGRLGFVGENLKTAGVETAKDVAEAMGGKGKVLISSVAQSSTWSRQRQDGVEEVFAQYPDIEIVQVVDCPGSDQDVYGTLENALLANQDINGHVSLGGTAYIFARVMKQNDIGNIDSDKPIYVSGHDLTPADEVLGQIKDGWLYSMYTQQPSNQGYQVVKMLANFLSTGETDVFEVMDSEIKSVSRDNYEEYVEMLEAGEPVG
ncbi:MAG: sugar ABC transporter substrate-binding protein [Clostridiales Family XIII bacterium]|jgi:simple sugar transport system substrate-binding protein/ribose transport system substrate-binding protein|nr:sugar ABC transporter substrate-binding protein [Clostridiales Family XIII bacterium]